MSVLDLFRRLANSARFGYGGAMLLLSVAAIGGILGTSQLMIAFNVAVAWLVIGTAYYIERTGGEVPA